MYVYVYVCGRLGRERKNRDVKLWSYFLKIILFKYKDLKINQLNLSYNAYSILFYFR